MAALRELLLIHPIDTKRQNQSHLRLFANPRLLRPSLPFLPVQFDHRRFTHGAWPKNRNATHRTRLRLFSRDTSGLRIFQRDARESHHNDAVSHIKISIIMRKITTTAQFFLL